MTVKTQSFKKTDKQVEAIDLLGGPARQILLYGGSRSGKSVILLYAMIVRALTVKSRHLALRYRFNHIKTSIWRDTLPKVLEFTCPQLPVQWNDSDFFVGFPNGSEIWIGGLDDKKRTEKVLGTEYSTILFNECSQLTYDSVQTALTRLAENSGLVNRAYFDENPPHVKHWSHKLWIDHVDPEDGTPITTPDDYACMLMNPADNRENLPADYIENVLGRLTRRKRARFLEGKWGEDNEGALWLYDDILRVDPKNLPPMDRIVVAIDPPKFHKDSSDEAGIGVAGRSGNRLIVLEDLSDRLSPKGWGGRAVNAFFRWKADRVIGEVNNGGEMVETIVHSINENVPFRAVTATRGKAVRAEPVAALYEQHRGYHAGMFPELEDQMTTRFDALVHDDRVDWLVWAATALMFDGEDGGDVDILDDY